MAIAFVSGSNTAYGPRTNITIAPPAGLADGNIMVAQIAVGDGAIRTPGTPTGWNVFGTDFSDNAAGFFVNNRTFWKRALSESGSYTFTTISSSSSAGWIGCYSGCIATGTPLAATLTNTGTGTTSTGLGITTTAPNSFLLWLGQDFADTTNPLSPPTGMTERLDAVVIYTADQLIASAGPTGNRTMTNNSGSSSPWGVRMVELLAATGGGTTTYVFNPPFLP